MSPWGKAEFQTKGKMLTFHPSRLWENGFAEGKLTLLEKHQNETNSSLKKYQKLLTLKIFFFMCAVCTVILSAIEKSNNTIFTVSKIQTITKLINLTTILFAELLLLVVWSKLLEW